MHGLILSLWICVSLDTAWAKRILVFPFQAPHLSHAQTEQQTRLLYRKTQKIRGLSIIPLSQAQRAIRRQNFKLKELKKAQKSQWSVKRLCIAVQSEFALSVSMKLGTDYKPAKLLGVLFRCGRSEQSIDYLELPFEGKLSSQLWTIFSESLEELITSPTRKKVSKTQTAPLPNTEYLSSSGRWSPQTRHQEANSVSSRIPQPIQLNQPSMNVSNPTLPMTAPTSSNNIRVESSQTLESAAVAMDDPLQEIPSRIEASRFQILAGARLLTKNLSYTTRPESRSLQGGLRYQSSWLTGWGAQLTLRPSPSRRLTLMAEYEQFSFTSERMINNLFTVSGVEETKSLAFKTNLRRWSGALRYTYPIRTQTLVHQSGIQLAYHGTLMDIEQNTDFLGLDMHQAELGIFGEFVIKPKRFYLALNAGFYPFVYLGNRSEEFGKAAETYGLNSKISFRYRSTDGISISFYIKLDFTFIEPNGTGRDGRVGESAKDQNLSLGLNIGYASSP